MYRRVRGASAAAGARAPGICACGAHRRSAPVAPAGACAAPRRRSKSGARYPVDEPLARPGQRRGRRREGCRPRRPAPLPAWPLERFHDDAQLARHICSVRPDRVMIKFPAAWRHVGGKRAACGRAPVGGPHDGARLRAGRPQIQAASSGSGEGAGAGGEAKGGRRGTPHPPAQGAALDSRCTTLSGSRERERDAVRLLSSSSPPPPRPRPRASESASGRLPQLRPGGAFAAAQVGAVRQEAGPGALRARGGGQKNEKRARSPR